MNADVQEFKDIDSLPSVGDGDLYRKDKFALQRGSARQGGEDFEFTLGMRALPDPT